MCYHYARFGSSGERYNSNNNNNYYYYYYYYYYQIIIIYSYSLRAGWSGDRIPMEARLSAPVHTGRRAHPDAYTMGTGSFPGVKWPGRGVDYIPHLQPRLKKE